MTEALGNAAGSGGAQDGFAVTADIINASDADITLSLVQIYDGGWQGEQPSAGSVLHPSSRQSFTNISGNAFGPLGATLTFVPASGGQLAMTWSWHPGTALQAYGTASSSTLTLSFNTVNTSSKQATVTYVITDVAASALVQAS